MSYKLTFRIGLNVGSVPLSSLEIKEAMHSAQYTLMNRGISGGTWLHTEVELYYDLQTGHGWWNDGINPITEKSLVLLIVEEESVLSNLHPNGIEGLCKWVAEELCGIFRQQCVLHYAEIVPKIHYTMSTK